jgi:RNA polymerase sigma-70 factor (ECF subfamily)
MSTNQLPDESYQMDALLVQKAQRGENEAFDQLFQRHYARILHFCRNMEIDADTAEDIAQTTFVRAYESLAQLKDAKAFVGWLYRIAVNLNKDRIKSERRKPWTFLRDIFQNSTNAFDEERISEMTDKSAEPQDRVVTDALNQSIRHAIASLPKDFRAVVVMRHLENRDLKEIAALLHCPEGTIKSRLGRARMRLREELKDWFEMEG